MKQPFLILTCFFITNYTSAQQAKHVPNAKAKILNDSATKKYQRAMGDPDKMKTVMTLLDAAIKADNNYYDAWNNKLSLQGQMEQFEDAVKTAKAMEHQFPKEEEVQFHLAILEYVTKHNKEAMATWNKLLDHYNALLEKNKNNANTKGLLYNKGIVLILLDKQTEGKAILNKLYKEEKDPYLQSSIAFYINSSRQEIINDKIPGK